MKPVLLTALVMALVLGGCSRDMESPAAAAESAPAPAASPAEDPMPAPGAGSATDSAPTPAPVDPAQMASFLGYGDMRLGSSADEARRAWGGDLNGSPSEPQGCHYLTPKWVANSSEMGFMIEGDRFVRYDVGTAKEAAPGGGKVGMTAQQLQALYGALDSVPHKYVEGGRYLSLAASGAAPTRLVFETDPAGTVSSWRVGIEPQVDYVEGCS